MTPRRFLLLSLPASLLLGACAAHKPPQVVYVQAPAALPPPDGNKVRVPDRIHAYSVGRLPTADGLAMNEAHQYYRIEDSAHWDQRLPDHPMGSSGPLGKFAPPTARRVAVSREVHAAEAHNEVLAQSMMQARDTYRSAATKVQDQALAAEKNRVTAETYRTLLQTKEAENNQLRAENERLRSAVDAPAAAKPGVTPGPSANSDPYERLKAWDRQSDTSPSPSPSPR